MTEFPARSGIAAEAVISGSGLAVIDSDGRLVEHLDVRLAEVFRLCDGTRSIAAMAALLAAGGDVEAVCSALDDLYDLGLLARRAVPPAGSDRVRATGMALPGEAPPRSTGRPHGRRGLEFGMPAEQSAKLNAERNAKASAERNSKASSAAVEQANKAQEQKLKHGGASSEQSNKAQERTQKGNTGAVEQNNKAQAAAENTSKVQAGEQNGKKQAQGEQKQKRGG